jgi:hypothetical protein
MLPFELRISSRKGTVAKYYDEILAEISLLSE